MSHHKPSKKAHVMQAKIARKRTHSALAGPHQSATLHKVEVSPAATALASRTSPGLAARRLTSTSVGLTDVATLIGGAASTGLATATLVPALPAAVLVAAAAGSVAAFIIGRRLEVRSAARDAAAHAAEASRRG